VWGAGPNQEEKVSVGGAVICFNLTNQACGWRAALDEKTLPPGGGKTSPRGGVGLPGGGSRIKVSSEQGGVFRTGSAEADLIIKA